MSRAERETGHVDWRAEDGVVAGAEALAFGVLIFVIGTLIVVNAWAVVDTKMAASAAAREAARLVVESPDLSYAELQGRAQAVAQATVHGHGKELAQLGTVSFGLGTDGRLTRCERITVRVPISLPTVELPLVSGFGGSFQLTGTHTEIVDPFRSGLRPERDCDV